MYVYMYAHTYIYAIFRKSSTPIGIGQVIKISRISIFAFMMPVENQRNLYGCVRDGMKLDTLSCMFLSVQVYVERDNREIKVCKTVYLFVRIYFNKHF